MQAFWQHPISNINVFVQSTSKFWLSAFLLDRLNSLLATESLIETASAPRFWSWLFSSSTQICDCSCINMLCDLSSGVISIVLLLFVPTRNGLRTVGRQRIAALWRLTTIMRRNRQMASSTPHESRYPCLVIAPTQQVTPADYFYFKLHASHISFSFLVYTITKILSVIRRRRFFKKCLYRLAAEDAHFYASFASRLGKIFLEIMLKGLGAYKSHTFSNVQGVLKELTIGGRHNFWVRYGFSKVLFRSCEILL